MRVSGLYFSAAYNSAWRTGWQYKPETYAHRTEVGGDGGKVPPMIITNLEAPPAPPSGGNHLRTLLLKVG